MPRILQMESEYALLWHDPDLHLIHHQILKPIFGEAFRELLLTGLRVLKETGADRWLSDDRANAILPAEDSDWSDHYWFPRVVKAGWKYWALVLPEKRLAQINMERLTANVAAGGVVVRFFSKPEDARDWLATL